MRKVSTAVGFFARARVFFHAHGIHRLNPRRHRFPRGRIHPVLFDCRPPPNGPGPYTPRHNGKVERYQRILADELLYARVFDSETDREHALERWPIHYN